MEERSGAFSVIDPENDWKKAGITQPGDERGLDQRGLAEAGPAEQDHERFVHNALK